MTQDQKRAEGLISFEAGRSIELGGIEAPEARKLKPWRPKKSLKELIVESSDPRLEIYRKLIRAWPQISNAKLTEIVREVDRDRLEKVLYLHEKTGRIFEELLDPNLSYEELKILDSVRRYYGLLEIAERQGILEKLKKAEPLDHQVTIDGRKFKAKLYAFLDSKPIKLEYYENEWRRPEIGLAYRFWPCFENYKAETKELAKQIAEEISNEKLDFSKIDQLKFRLDKIRTIENDFLRLSISMFVQFPPKYASKKGVFGGRLYVNRIRYPCGLCGGGHDLWLICEVR